MGGEPTGSQGAWDWVAVVASWELLSYGGAVMVEHDDPAPLYAEMNGYSAIVNLQGKGSHSGIVVSRLFVFSWFVVLVRCSFFFDRIWVSYDYSDRAGNFFRSFASGS